MSKPTHLPPQPLATMQQVAQYLDNDVPLQQLEATTPADAPTFMQAQLDYAKSKQGRQVKRRKARYKKWYKQGGNT